MYEYLECESVTKFSSQTGFVGRNLTNKMQRQISTRLIVVWDFLPEWIG